MDKPKAKTKDKLLPREMKRMLMEEYKNTANARNNNERPEHNAVNSYEQSINNANYRLSGAAQKQLNKKKPAPKARQANAKNNNGNENQKTGAANENSSANNKPTLANASNSNALMQSNRANTKATDREKNANPASNSEAGFNYVEKTDNLKQTEIRKQQAKQNIVTKQKNEIKGNSIKYKNAENRTFSDYTPANNAVRSKSYSTGVNNSGYVRQNSISITNAGVGTAKDSKSYPKTRSHYAGNNKMNNAYAMPRSKALAHNGGIKSKSVQNASEMPEKIKKAQVRRERAEKTIKTLKRAAAKTLAVAKKVAKAVGKAVVATGKTIASIAVAAGPVFLIVAAFAVIAVVAASPLGFFISSKDNSPGTVPVRSIVQETCTDFDSYIEKILAENYHDELDIQYVNQGYARPDNWIDILAVFAVKTADMDNGSDVVVIDSVKAEKLKSVFWDMTKTEYYIETVEHREMVTLINEYGIEYEYEEITYTYILHIKITAKNAWEMADIYGFSRNQREVLQEMLNGEYDSYFNEMLVNVSMVGDGSGTIGTGSFVWPSSASDYVTSPFGYRVHPVTGEWKNHPGVDIAAPANTAVLAADSGTVVSNSIYPSYGTHLLIDHGNGTQTLYAHMNAANVDIGDAVEQGQIIGIVGSTGVSTGPHLHFEVYSGGSRVNPLDYFSNYTTAW